MRMDQLNGHRSLADRRRAPLRRAGPSVAGREDAGDARLRQAHRLRSHASEDEAVLVARITSRSTAMYREGCVTTAVTKTVWPESRVQLAEEPRRSVANDL